MNCYLCLFLIEPKMLSVLVELPINKLSLDVPDVITKFIYVVCPNDDLLHFIMIVSVQKEVLPNTGRRGHLNIHTLLQMLIFHTKAL